MPNNALLYVHAITSLHPGSGTALGVVDLPIQRERHTDWPTIPGTSMKGVLRDHAVQDGVEQSRIDRLFGKGGEEGKSGGFEAGTLSFTDARVLAFPVRSLHGVFAWVTCPQALRRWQRDATLAGCKPDLPALNLEPDTVLVPTGSPCQVPGKPEVILEEFCFKVRPAQPLALPLLEGLDPKRVLVLGDDDFTYFVRHATEVTARIGLDPKTKTVKGGALFYQEFLPSETLLYSLVLFSHRVPDNTPYDPPEIVQLGGDETTGKGICRLTIVKGA